LKKLFILSFCLLFYFAACTDETEKMYRWENLEKELREVAKEAIKEITAKNQAVDAETKRSGVTCSVSFYDNTYTISFVLQKAKQKRILAKSLEKIHGIPNPEWKRTKEYHTERLSWNGCKSWYYGITVIEYRMVGMDYVCAIHINFHKESL